MDANAHHPHWGSAAVDARGTILFVFLDSANLVCLNSGEPTFCSSSGLFSHIDLTFCFPTLALPHFFLGMPHPHFDSFNSDHFPILLDSSFSYPCTSSIPKWNLSASAADWDCFRSDLHLPTQFDSPDQSCQSTSDALLSAATHFVQLSSFQRLALAVELLFGGPVPAQRPGGRKMMLWQVTGTTEVTSPPG